MAGVFAVAMLSGVAGNVGTVKSQAAVKNLGTISQTDFDTSCLKRSGYYGATLVYNFSTWKCTYTNLSSLNIFLSNFSINWDEVCRDKYDKNRYYFPWERAYANWKTCYRNI
jgi:hypothetical protein